MIQGEPKKSKNKICLHVIIYGGPEVRVSNSLWKKEQTKPKQTEEYTTAEASQTPLNSAGGKKKSGIKREGELFIPPDYEEGSGSTSSQIISKATKSLESTGGGKHLNSILSSVLL